MHTRVLVCQTPQEEYAMTQEQFRHFWLQLKGPLKAKWDKVVQKRYGEVDKHEVRIWADRRHAVWSGNYIGYKDPQPAS
jgi:hypothetical protein